MNMGRVFQDGAPSPGGLRNQGLPLDPETGPLPLPRIFPGRAHRRAAALEREDGPRGGAALPGLLAAISYLDLTTLSGDDTPGRIRDLCRRARDPLGGELRYRLGLPPGAVEVAAVCVYPVFVGQALEALEGSGVRVATVAGGFPHGLTLAPERVREVQAAVEAGAHEVDVVIRREWALTGKWPELYGEVRAFREAAGKACLKVILATGELGTLTRVSQAAMTAMMAGADFVKTSTGKEAVNATLPVGYAMARAIKGYHERSGFRVGLKPAGGIRPAREALLWQKLVRKTLGEAWASPSLFRIGASSLLDELRSALRECTAPGTGS